MVPIPDNLPCLLDTAEPWQVEVIERILNGQTDLTQNLLDLSKWWNIHVWFSEPVTVRVMPRWGKPDAEGWRHRIFEKVVTDYVFRKFFRHDYHGLCYVFKRLGRKGWYFNKDKVMRYEPVPIKRR